MSRGRKQTSGALALATLFGPLALAQQEPLAIRVADAIGVPGGTAAIVLRTYASRPIGQGQLCFKAPTQSPDQAPLDNIQTSQVFGVFPDVTSTHTGLLEQDPQTFLLEFASPSASINADDGPLAVFFVQLRDTLIPGTEIDLLLDLPNSALAGEDGLPIAIDPRHGKLRIRAPGTPIEAAANAEKTPPGGIALLTFQTSEPFPISRGRVVLRYDPAVAVGDPVISMDPRNGSSVYNVELPAPGEVVVTFESPDLTLNTVPGDIVSVRIPTLATIPSGTLSPVSLDPALTFLEDAAGAPIALALESDVLEFIDPATVSLGTATRLRMRRLPDDRLQLLWEQSCGIGPGFAIYRGDLALGPASLALEPGYCAVSGTSAAIPLGPGEADFFLVVPIGNGEEGSYGADSLGVPRPPATAACFPQGSLAACAP